VGHGPLVFGLASSLFILYNMLEMRRVVASQNYIATKVTSGVSIHVNN